MNNDFPQICAANGFKSFLALAEYAVEQRIQSGQMTAAEADNLAYCAASAAEVVGSVCRCAAFATLDNETPENKNCAAFAALVAADSLEHFSAIIQSVHAYKEKPGNFI